MAEAIRAHRLFAAYRAPAGTVVALQGLSLRAEASEVLGIVGPSGSGKSTLLRCLAGRDRPLAGELTVFSRPLHEASNRQLARYRARTVALVHQRYARALSPDLPISRIVELRPALLGWPAAERRERAHELLERVGLGDRADARRTELSGGEQQRVALCVALAAQPKLLLADEVTGELDDESGELVLRTLRELAAAEGTTVLLVTHDEKAGAICDRTLTIRDGRVTGELRHGPTDRRRVLVDDGGVLRIDPEDLAAAGVHGKAGLEVGPCRIVLTGEPASVRLPERPRHRAPVRLGVARLPPVAVLDAVTRRFTGRGSPAVSAVDLEIAPGRLHVLSGPSGCGKTTLIHLIAGLDRADAGTITLLGTDLGACARTALAELRRRHVAIVPQATALVPFLDARENVELALIARGATARDARERAREALALVGLEEVAHHPAGRLSSGQRQRAAVARAVAARPDLLLADEPTANLDERSAVLVADLLAETARAHGTAVLCATHDHSVEHRADLVTHLRSGCVTAGRTLARCSDSRTV
jgi:ABC-type lipoprotein export system ATPase subunit